jgi:O-antigen ligase
MNQEVAGQPVADHGRAAAPSRLPRSVQAWRDVAAKFVLFFFAVALWAKFLSLSVGILLTLVWILDNGHRRLGQTVKEPLALAILILCGLLALGILWGEHSTQDI